MVVALLAYPLYCLITYPAVEGRTGFGGAFVLGFKAGARNYLPLLGFIILTTVMLVVGGLVTLTIGFIVLLPVNLLAATCVYRQATGGRIPAN